MVASATAPRIAILGPQDPAPATLRRCCATLPVGYAEAVRVAGGEPVFLDEHGAETPWRTALNGVSGLVWTNRASLFASSLYQWCRKHRFPVLAIDDGLLALNQAAGGTTHRDLAVERPEALQHLHRPEPGLRHAITVEPDTLLADLYGEGEIVVNSEHRSGIDRMATGFRVSARALDGVIEATETEMADWFVLGVQWRPAAASASGLDIQLFRGLVHAAEQRLPRSQKRRRSVSSAA